MINTFWRADIADAMAMDDQGASAALENMVRADMATALLLMLLMLLTLLMWML